MPILTIEGFGLELYLKRLGQGEGEAGDTVIKGDSVNGEGRGVKDGFVWAGGGRYFCRVKFIMTGKSALFQVLFVYSMDSYQEFILSG